MTDYNKQTVANLRLLLKDRSIPSTGLTRKAQIIEKLEEWDTAQSSAPAAVTPEAPETAAQPDEQQGEKETQDEAAPVEGEEPKTSEPAPPVAATEPTTAPSAAPPAAVPDTTAAEEPQDTVMATETSVPQPVEEPTAAPPEPVEQVEPETEPAAIPSQPAQAVPAIQANDTEMSEKTASPDPNEKPSIEKPELLPIPEQSANTTAENSRLNSEEREAERRKRKRRSQSPELSTQEIRVKKPRPSQEPAPDVHLKEDEDVVMEQRAPEPVEEKAAEESKEDITNEASGAAGKKEAVGSTTPPTQEPDAKRPAPDRKDKAPRYRELFQPTATATPAEALTDDRPIVPALHPATPAVYIRNFMRPLRPEPLRSHLVSLASPPSGSPDPSIVKSLFLDAMKTHALVLFSTTTAASRVRASLHGSIWPPEGNRKELWVDFVPEDRVEEWIKEEEDAITAEKDSRASGRPIPAKRFEVVYPETEDGTIRAVFQEVGSGSSNAPFNAPRGPRSNIEARRESYQQQGPAPSAPTQETRQDMDKNFDILGQHFNCTTAKPKLYFLPVSDDIADARLKDLDGETSRDWFPEERHKGRGIVGRLDEKVRFSFDGEDRVVEVGGDFGPWADDSRRGGRGGRGGFRGRGGRGGGSWRG